MKDNMQLTFYLKESIVLLFNKTNLSNTILSFHSKLMLTFFLLVLFTNISFGNINSGIGQTSNYFSTQIQNYSKGILIEVIEELEDCRQETDIYSEWVTLYKELSATIAVGDNNRNSVFEPANLPGLINPLALTDGFQILSEGNFRLSHGPHIHGPLGVGGNLIIDAQFQAEVNMDPVGNYIFPGDGSTSTGLLVSGGVGWVSGFVGVKNNKYIHVGNNTGCIESDNGVNMGTQILPSGTSYNNTPRIEGTIDQTPNPAVFQNGDFDFTSIFNSFRTYSEGMANCTENVQLYMSNNSPITNNELTYSQDVKITSLATGTNYLNLTTAALSNVGSIIFEGNGTPTATKPLIINVSLSSDYIWNNSNMSGISNAAGQYIIWNFSGTQTHTLTINTAAQIKGTVFAPNHDLVKLGTGDIEGGVIAKTIDIGIGEIHYYQFASDIEICDNSATSCQITNTDPGFVLDLSNTGCNLDYLLDNDLSFEHNSDGTASITGKIVGAIDADWDACTATPCGTDDEWYVELTLSDKQSWAEWQATGGTANVHTNCNAASLDYWAVSGTLTGLGCNAGRTVTVNSASNNYRLQIGYGGNSNDLNCDFGLSTWFDTEENGSFIPSDIYGFLDEVCYNKTTLSKNVCYLISDGDGDGWMVPDTFYTFNHLTGTITSVGPTGTMNIEAMALDTVNHIIYTANDNDFGVIDIATGAFTAINTDMGSLNGAEGNHNINDLDGMTYDYTNNIIWATERASGVDGLPDDLLLKIDPATGMPIADGFGVGVDYLTINTNENDLDDIAISADGTLYAISNLGSSGNQRLGIINTTTGAWTELGDYGIEDVESLTFSAEGQLLATTGEDGDHQNSLYSIDASTAEATYVGSILPAQDVEACACNFGNFINLQLGDKVWADLDADGIQDIEEPGLKNVTVNLLNEDGTPYLNVSNNPVTTRTDIYGIYNFEGLSPGNYMVEFELPTGTSFSNKDIGGDDTKDSDADATTGRTGVITLSGSRNNRDADAGILNANVVVRDCDDAGELFVVDELGGAVLRFNPTTGALIDTFISGLSIPKEMIVGADNYLYISDAGLNEIRRYSLITGAFIDVLARNLKSPNGMTFDSNGMLYVNNKSMDQVLKIDPSDGTTSVFVTEQAGGLDSNNGGIEFGPDGNLYVASRTTDQVLRFNGTTGAFIDIFVAAGSGTLNGPDDIAFGADGQLYVVSSYSDQVKRYNGTTGAFVDDFITYQSGGLRAPRGLTFASDGNIYVSGQTSPDGIYRYNGTTGAFLDLFVAGLQDPRGILFAPVPNCSFVCDLQFDNITVSNCINHPLMDVATVDATISWTDSPANDTIEVSIANQIVYIDVAGGITSPYTAQFTIPADGSTGNNITATWRNNPSCNQIDTYDAPAACSSDEITCDILYICGDDKPYDGDAWDHGWLKYLDEVNGSSSSITPAFSKPDASGMGLYDPNNINSALSINFSDYDLIIVSATTEARLSNDIINSLATTSVTVLNSNIEIFNDLGMTASEAGTAWQDDAFIDNTNSEVIYNYNNKIDPYGGLLFLTGDYGTNANVLLWEGAGDANSGIEGVLYSYTSDDVLPGIPASHGSRVFLGYHMNGVYGNSENNGAIPVPEAFWFDPAKHLTLVGKSYFDAALILAAANCGVSAPTCCSQINYANNSLEDGNFSSFTSSSNPNGVATLTTFGGSDAIDWDPSGGTGTNGSPITAYGANPGYWIDASTNGGLGALDGDRFYWLEPRNSVSGSDCLGAVSGADLLGSFCAGDTVEICGYVAAYDPNNINSNVANTDFKFEIYTNNGNDPADFITTPTGTTSINDNGGNNESLTVPLPASTNIQDITGAAFTGANGQVANWKTLNWQSICFQLVLKEDQSNYSSIVFSMSDGSDGMAIDNLSIRDITTPNAGKDTTLYNCSTNLDLVAAQNGETWSKVEEPTGVSATIDASTGAITGLTKNGIYKFLLSKTVDATCHDTIKVTVNCVAEICDDGIDNDGDGLTDCEDPDCNAIRIADLSFSECVLTGNEYQATMTLEVTWTNPPVGEGINVVIPNNSQFIDVFGGATSPATVQFVITADNSTNLLSLAYSGGTSCGVDSYYEAPSPCPDPPTERNIPCTNASGYVGGTVFEDLNGDGLQDAGEPGLEGIMVTATDSIGDEVGQTLTNNIGVFEFSSLTDGRKYRLEFTAIPSGMYPTNGSTYKGTTVQFVDAPSCTTTLGLLNPTKNLCEATSNSILQNGYSVVACLPAGDDVTLAVKDITQLGTLWQTSANRNTNQYSNVPTVHMWETSDFEGEEIFSMTIDSRDGTIYAVSSPLYGDGSNVSSVLFEENIPAKVFRINPETGVVTRIAQLSGTLGLGYIDFDGINEQLLITNMDDGKIYRLNTDGVVLGSYDPLTVDDGIDGQLPTLGDRILGVTFNPIEKKVYYSVWSNHTTFVTDYENINNNFNTIRSVALDVNGNFLPATDQIEITVPYNSGATENLTAPTADLAFNRAGDRLLLAEFSITENNSNGQLSTSAHTSVVREYQRIAGVWTLEPTYASNNQGKYDIGSLIGYRGQNSRGGIDWGYERVSGDTIFGNEDFILATGDALHVSVYEGDFIYGYQFTPATGGNIANSILVDLDDDLINADKYVYSDVDIYKDYCPELSLEIGNYIWLDTDEDGTQDVYEIGLAGINVTLFNATGDSLTSVTTDANGAYYFNENTNGFAGLTPNTTYYIVVGKGGQFNPTNGALGFVFDLTVPNIGDGNYQDENDSDGIIGALGYGHPVNIIGYPVIELTTGENGQNNYSYDFGFKEICSAAITMNDSIPTCPGVEYEGSVSLNDSNYEDKIYSVLSNPSRGTVTMEDNGTFTYVGNEVTCMSDEFIYQVCDPSNICCSYAVVYLDFADTTKPTLQNIPPNDTISCDEEVPLPPKIFAQDNCPRIALDVKEEDTQGEDGCSLHDYTITRTWTAMDECGNSTSASQVIEVQDLVAPDIYRVYTLPNGKKMVAGVMELVGGNWKTVNLPIDFDTKPIILHQVTTNDGLTPVIAQVQNVSISQFELKIAAEEANVTKRTRESVSWIAMEEGTQNTDYQLEVNSLFLTDVPEVVNFQNSFATVPALFTSAQTTNEEDPVTVRYDALSTSGTTLVVQEEASNDAELVHFTERTGYLALENIGDLRDEKGILLGEVGTITLDDGWTTITLNNTYANPVIIANSLSSTDGEAATVRIQNVGLNSFEVKIEEWAYLDGNHANETVSYMVVEGSIPLESPTYCDDGTDSLDIGIDFKAVDNCDVSIIINYTEKDTFIGATKIVTRTWAAEDECGNATSYNQVISCEGVSLQLKGMLQGAMLGNEGDGLMRDDLRKKGILPIQEPYSQMTPFEHVNNGGGEIMDPDLLAVDGPDAIVDWIFVELRDASDIENVVATCSGLIQRDGDVVNEEGDSIIHFTNTRVGNYFVSLRHRNHLGMITLNTESFTPSSIPFVDFTYVFTPVVGTNSSAKIDNLESLWSGDLNSDGKVIYQGPNNDIFYMFLHVLQDEGNKGFLPNFISRGYTNDDFNLDGTVIYQGPNNDRAVLLFNTILRHPDNPQKFSNFIIYQGEGGN